MAPSTTPTNLRDHPSPPPVRRDPPSLPLNPARAEDLPRAIVGLVRNNVLMRRMRPRRGRRRWLLLIRVGGISPLDRVLFVRRRKRRRMSRPYPSGGPSHSGAPIRANSKRCLIRRSSNNISSTLNPLHPSLSRLPSIRRETRPSVGNGESPTLTWTTGQARSSTTIMILDRMGESRWALMWGCRLRVEDKPRDMRTILRQGTARSREARRLCPIVALSSTSRNNSSSNTMAEELPLTIRMPRLRGVIRTTRIRMRLVRVDNSAEGSNSWQSGRVGNRSTRSASARLSVR
jgi:hypothetical protein